MHLEPYQSKIYNEKNQRIIRTILDYCQKTVGPFSCVDIFNCWNFEKLFRILVKMCINNCCS